MNVLWICTDQQRFDSLGCYGNPVVDTPNLDKLAQEGVLFENCYSQSPVCSPSRASFLTGRYPQVCNMYENGASIGEDELLVTKVFAENGYTCGLSGKLHIRVCNPAVCTSVESRVQDGYSSFYWSHHQDGDWPLNDYHIWLAEKGAKFQREAYPHCSYIYKGMPRHLSHTAYCADRAMDFIKRHKDSDTSWLFSVNIFDPHHPFDPPEELLEKYIGKLQEIALPNYVEGELDSKGIYQQTDHKGAYGGVAGHPFTEMTEADHKLQTAAYYAMVELIDNAVGDMLTCLKETGQYQDTMVVFTSDHGEMLGDHGIYLKGPYFYEGAVHVPLILSCPGKVQAGLRVPALVELMDIPETLLDAAGLDIPGCMMGKSLLPIAAGKADPDVHRESVFCEYYNAMPWHKAPPAKLSMLFDGRYKLVVNHSCGGGELYDLKEEPQETTNQWDNPAYCAQKLDLFARLADKLIDMRDPAYTRVADW